LQGTTYIKTANDDKNSSDASFLTFDVNQDVTVYVGHDNRKSDKPSWLASFTDTGEDIVNSDTTFSLFDKDFSSGTVTLGGNEASSMYTVIIIGQGNDDDTTPPNSSISINNGAESTNSTSVTLSLSSDDNVGVTGYYLSAILTTPLASNPDWVSVTPTINFNADVPYTLSSVDGTKTVYVWYKDAAGNVSNAYSDSIILFTDSDGDGVADSIDKCPGFDDNVDTDGDGTPDGCDGLIDSDNDGVADSLDKCPGFDDNVDVDGDGTPDGCDDLIDSDNDGVADSEDKCPGFDDKVDTDGDGTPDGCDGDDDTIQPSTPTNLKAKFRNDKMMLSWNASTDNVGVTGYRIYRDGIQVADVAGNTYKDEGLSKNTTYVYTVSAYDAAGNESSKSTPVSTAANIPPEIPTGLKIVGT
jgi:hypothetical protein